MTDNQTGLMWEKKDDLGGIHAASRRFTWSVSSVRGQPDGEVFTRFVAGLNYGKSSDGETISGCFAGHCDWRLPTVAELNTLLLEPYPCDVPSVY